MRSQNRKSRSFTPGVARLETRKLLTNFHPCDGTEELTPITPTDRNPYPMNTVATYRPCDSPTVFYD